MWNWEIVSDRCLNMCICYWNVGGMITTRMDLKGKIIPEERNWWHKVSKETKCEFEFKTLINVSSPCAVSFPSVLKRIMAVFVNAMFLLGIVL